LWHDDNPEWVHLAKSDELRDMQAELDAVNKELASFAGAVLPLMQEREPAGTRPTRLFIRGNWLERGPEQSPGVPSVMPPIDHPAPGRRELAAWLTSEVNPLTARVVANRLWAVLFGVGIVETLEDFGSAGAPPSHPELIDHLAIRLQHHHRWRWKPFLREIVLSSTYRQSQHVPPPLRDRDPYNRLLARGPRTRLTAEMVRDQALQVSGLLASTIGGPSVMPPQPEGVWRTVYNNAEWKTASGPNRYRRGIYTYWRRTSPYPSFVMFDTPSREVCSPRRVTTNTPLQALVTLNDPVYVEAAAALSERARRMTDGTPPAAIRWAYRAVTQRDPSPAALRQLVALYEETCGELEQADSGELSEKTTPSSDDGQTASPQSPAAAAMNVVTNTILNLDLALTK
jgi:hypothetical protein